MIGLYKPRRWKHSAGAGLTEREMILPSGRPPAGGASRSASPWLRRKQAGYYSNPDGTEWAKADALLDQLK